MPARCRALVARQWCELVRSPVVGPDSPRMPGSDRPDQSTVYTGERVPGGPREREKAKVLADLGGRRATGEGFQQVVPLLLLGRPLRLIKKKPSEETLGSRAKQRQRSRRAERLRRKRWAATTMQKRV